MWRFGGKLARPSLAETNAISAVPDGREWYDFEGASSLETDGRDDSIVPLVVDNTITALGRLAAYYRREVVSPTTEVIAITGSNGKTTTKLMLHHLLSASFPGRCAPRSFNNEIGVPLTLLSAEPDDRYLIVEIGSSAPGEVAHLGQMAAPTIGVITSIGEAHLSGFGDLTTIAAEKASLMDHIASGGLCVVNIESDELTNQMGTPRGCEVWTVGRTPGSKFALAEVEGSLSGTTFSLSGFGRVHVPLPGSHHAVNAAAAMVVAQRLGLLGEDMIRRFHSFVPPAGRARIVRIGDITLMDDTYNANPASVEAAIESLLLADTGRRVFVLGDMLELGDASARLHRRVVRRIVDAKFDLLITVGRKTRQAAGEVKNEGTLMMMVACEDSESAGEALDSLLQSGDTVWIKASRELQLERIVERIRSSYGERVAMA
ncbi:MAG: UDP-N-acetylmuramoyl-tripeptide--D-alanyl-D-alanine ligase [Planctomycetes bacterium]|nr:UDP-N-acetylmuramoyl-tripeptide--D-alanyl-D-alanine ligase [Planctomycetota bacterium]